MDLTHTSQNTSVFQSSYRIRNAAPFLMPVSGMVQLRLYLDQTVLELFASNCQCAAEARCECQDANETAVAVTGLAFPLRNNATSLGLYAKGDACRGMGSVKASIYRTVRAPVVEVPL